VGISGQQGSSLDVKVELDPDPGTGRRRQKWRSGHHTLGAAERARVDLLSKLDRGEYVKPTHQTVAYLNEWCLAIRTLRQMSAVNEADAGREVWVRQLW
jgi:hypothetical protein